MVILINERQKYLLKNFKNKIKIFEEDDSIDLNQPVDLSKIKSAKDLKTIGKKIGLQKGEKTKSRKSALELSKKISKNIEKVSGEKTLDHYFEVIANLLSKYKRSDVLLDRLHLIIDDLSTKDINVAKAQMEAINLVFSDPRFNETHKKDLLSFLLRNPDEIDLDTFFEKTQKAYSAFEKSFTKGDMTPFVNKFTKPQLKISLGSDFEYNNMKILASEFNEKASDVSKVLYILDSMAKANFRVNPNDFISYVMSNLKFKINFDYSPENVKSDLFLKEPLIIDVKKFLPQTVAEKNKNIECKMYVPNEDHYLSEFFKVDSTTENVMKIEQSMSKIPGILDVKESFKIFMKSMVDNFFSSVQKQGGDKIINHLTKDLAGFIFKNDIFVGINNIKFYWNNRGYANRFRLAIWYHVDENAKKYKISKDSSGGFTRFLLEV